MIYTDRDLTWGCELEFGDVDRSFKIPDELGSWEHFETMLVNQREPYWGIGSDPYGINPPVGGEINTRPTRTWYEQIEIIKELIELLKPTVNCVAQTHIHVGIIKHTKTILFQNFRNLVIYIRNNQKAFIELTNQYVYDERMSDFAVQFFRDFCGAIAPDDLYENILKHKTHREMYKEMLEYDADLNLDSVPNRYGVNLRSLCYNKTIEFRSFRASINLRELIHCFRICEVFILNGLNGIDNPIANIIEQENYKFPPFEYDHELFMSWQKTRRPIRTDVQKTRNFIQIPVL